MLMLTTDDDQQIINTQSVVRPLDLMTKLTLIGVAIGIAQLGIEIFALRRDRKR